MLIENQVFKRVDIEKRLSDNILKPEPEFEELTEEKQRERKKEEVQKGNDKFGFRLGSACSEASKMIAQGQFAAADIKTKCPSANVSFVISKLKDKGFIVEKIKKGDRKILVMKE